jgi:hypothetical protein
MYCKRVTRVQALFEQAYAGPSLARTCSYRGLANPLCTSLAITLRDYYLLAAMHSRP